MSLSLVTCTTPNAVTVRNGATPGMKMLLVFSSCFISLKKFSPSPLLSTQAPHLYCSPFVYIILYLSFLPCFMTETWPIYITTWYRVNAQWILLTDYFKILYNVVFVICVSVISVKNNTSFKPTFPREPQSKYKQNDIHKCTSLSAYLIMWDKLQQMDC